MKKQNQTFVTITLHSGVVVTGERTTIKEFVPNSISVIQNVPYVKKKYLNPKHTLDENKMPIYEDHKHEYIEVRSKTVATVFNSTIKEIVYF